MRSFLILVILLLMISGCEILTTREHFSYISTISETPESVYNPYSFSKDLEIDTKQVILSTGWEPTFLLIFPLRLDLGGIERLVRKAMSDYPGYCGLSYVNVYRTVLKIPFLYSAQSWHLSGYLTKSEKF